MIHAVVDQTDPLKVLATPPAGNGLGEALTRLRRIVRPGSLVFCISDFFALDEDSGNHLLRLRQHNDVVAMRITDPIERVTPPPGRYAVTDGRRPGMLDTGSREGRRHYREFFRQRDQGIRELLQRRNIPLVDLSTADDVVTALQVRFGRQRGGALLRGAVA